MHGVSAHVLPPPVPDDDELDDDALEDDPLEDDALDDDPLVDEAVEEVADVVLPLAPPAALDDATDPPAADEFGAPPAPWEIVAPEPSAQPSVASVAMRLMTLRPPPRWIMHGV